MQNKLTMDVDDDRNKTEKMTIPHGTEPPHMWNAAWE